MDQIPDAVRHLVIGRIMNELEDDTLVVAYGEPMDGEELGETVKELVGSRNAIGGSELLELSNAAVEFEQDAGDGCVRDTTEEGLLEFILGEIGGLAGFESGHGGIVGWGWMAPLFSHISPSVVGISGRVDGGLRGCGVGRGRLRHGRGGGGGAWVEGRVDGRGGRSHFGLESSKHGCFVGSGEFG